jgi:hypothetical protein
MTIHHKAARLARATELAELCLKRLNEDRRSERRIRQAVMALRLCDAIREKLQKITSCHGQESNQNTDENL